MPREIACEFFAAFSRFEFALKEEGYVHNRFWRAASDWHTFAKSIAYMLLIAPNSELDTRVDYLLGELPHVQTSAQRWLHRLLRGSTRIAQALDAVQRVRHNLFHGG